MLDIHLIDPEVPEKVLQEVNREEEMIIKIMIKVKLLSYLNHFLQGEDENNYSMVKVEILSPKDYYFLYEHLCEIEDYYEMKQNQRLIQEYPEFLTMLIKLFNQAVVTPKTTKIQFQMNKDNSGDLFFQQVMEYESKPKRKGNDAAEQEKCKLVLLAY